MSISSSTVAWIVVILLGASGWSHPAGASRQPTPKGAPPPVAIDMAGKLQLHLFDTSATAVALTIQLDSGGHGDGIVDQLFVIKSSTPLPLKTLAIHGSLSYRMDPEQHTLSLRTDGREEWQFVVKGSAAGADVRSIQVARVFRLVNVGKLPLPELLSGALLMTRDR